MEYRYEKSFLKQKEKLVKKSILSEKQIDETIELYKKDKNSIKLYYHSICCKRDKHRKSIAVLRTVKFNRKKHKKID